MKKKEKRKIDEIFFIAKGEKKNQNDQQKQKEC